MACPQALDSIGKEAECEEFVITIPPELPLINIPLDLPPAEWPECCIYRVPKQLRKVNEEAYTPKLVSIGPFHHGREEFREMEMHKLRYFKDFFERETVTKSQKDLLQIIKDIEEKIRHCYSEDPLKIIKDNEEKICHCYSEHPLKIIKDNEEKINHCYSEDDFVQMILLDAIFIIELFLKVKEAAEKEESEKEEAQRKGKEYDKKETDYILSKPWLKTGILHDLILLENQLPFFVLEELYMFACNAPFVNLSRDYFKCYDRQQEFIITGKKVEHFTDLVRYLFCPSNMEQNWKKIMKQWSSTREEEESSGTRFCAKKLDDAGLKFEEVKDDRRLLDIELPGVLQQVPCHGLVGRLLCFGFERFPCLTISCLCACFPCFICFPCFMKCLLQFTRPGCFGRPMHILKIPHLVIDGYTEAIFRNLMALEQCHYPSETYICSYALLLDSLIDTEKDVDLLVDKKVIVNNLGSNAIVVDLINKLGDHIVVTPSSYFDYIGQNLNNHYEFPLNHFLATLTREYFPNVFRGTATVVGLIILGFTFWNFIRPFVV